ncbi:hypothetical protein pb186bvf_011789 [Paramecium bursaria]
MFHYFINRPEIPSFFFDDIFIPIQQRQGHQVPRPPYTNQNFREQVPKPPNLNKQESVKKSLEQFTPQQGQYWNILGDREMERKQYQKAIDFYNKAIEMTDGSESYIFKNRGEAYKMNRQLDLGLKDAIQAIELDDKNIKAHLLCGQILAEIGKFENSTSSIQTAITRLTKSLTLCAGQKKQFYEAELSKYIYRAKKLLWFKQQELERNSKREAIHQYKQVIEFDPHKEDKLQKFIQVIGDPDKPPNLEIPHYFICKITLDIMENPVTVESGHSYEKDVLIEHLQKNGPIDPATREPISGQFYTNHNLKQGIEYFLLNNPWAFEFQANQDYKDIEF